MKKKTIIILSIVVVLAIGTTVGVTLFLVNNVFRKPSQTPKEGEKIVYTEVNYSDVYAELNNKLNNGKTTKQLLEEETPLNIVNYSLAKKVNREYFYSETSGTTKALIATQTIYGQTIKNGNKYYQESISTGLINTAFAAISDGANVTVYNGKDIKEKTASYSKDDFKTYTTASFKEDWGIDYTQPTIYLVSEQTLLEANKTIEEDKYVISLNLEPKGASFKYIKQQKQSGKLDEFPEFTKVKLTFTIDESLNLLSQKSEETSKVKKGVWVSNKTTFVETFTYDIPKDIPTI